MANSRSNVNNFDCMTSIGYIGIHFEVYSESRNHHL